MPLIYGKTVHTAAIQLRETFGERGLLSEKESTANGYCQDSFWKEEYSGMQCFINTIQYTSWIASSINSIVRYDVSLYSTSPDYFKTDAIRLNVYDPKKKIFVRLRSEFLLIRERNFRQKTLASPTLSINRMLI
jgi:hypothetical protein